MCQFLLPGAALGDYADWVQIILLSKFGKFFYTTDLAVSARSQHPATTQSQVIFRVLYRCVNKSYKSIITPLHLVL